MSFVLACPICGAPITGPTTAPDIGMSHTAQDITCGRCDSIFALSLTLSRIGVRATQLPPMKTSKP